MSTKQLDIARGETKTFRVYVKHPDGTAKDITGMTASLVVKASTSDDALVLVELTASPYVDVGEGIDATDGVLEFYAVPADTEDLEPKSYSFDVWVMLGGDRWQVLGPLPFKVTPRVKSDFGP